jgi:hypothetical protein
VILTGGGRPGAPVVVRGLPGARLASDAWNALVIKDAAWIELRGLRLEYHGTERSGSSGNGLMIDGSTHIVVDGCAFIGFGGDGIQATASDHLRIQDSVVEDCGASAYGTQNGITIHAPRAAADGTGEHRIRIERNRILRSRVVAANRHNPGQWTGGCGIMLFATDPDAYPHRILVADNIIAHSAGSGISTFLLQRIDIRHNILHGSGLVPQHPGGDMQIASRDCTAQGNLLVPLPDRPAWHLRPTGALERRDNAVWESGPARRPEIMPSERLAGSPYLVPMADETRRTDFRLVPGLSVGPRR